MSAADSSAAAAPRHVRFRLRHRALALVDFFLGYRTAFLEVQHALLLDLGKIEVVWKRFRSRCGTVVVGLVGPRIDDEQQVAALHHFAFGEGHEVDIPGDPRADLDGLHGCRRPVNSSQSVTRFCSTCATLTSGGGGAEAAPPEPLQPGQDKSISHAAAMLTLTSLGTGISQISAPSAVFATVRGPNTWKACYERFAG